MLILPLKVRPVEEPSGYPPISLSMLIQHVLASSSASRWISVRLMSSLIGYPLANSCNDRQQHHEGAVSRLLSGPWQCCHQTVQSKLFSLRIAAFDYAIGVYDKRVSGFEHQLARLKLRALESAQQRAAGFQQADLIILAKQDGRKMTGVAVGERRSIAVHLCNECCDERGYWLQIA